MGDIEGMFTDRIFIHLMYSLRLLYPIIRLARTLQRPSRKHIASPTPSASDSGTHHYLPRILSLSSSTQELQVELHS